MADTHLTPGTRLRLRQARIAASIVVLADVVLLAAWELTPDGQRQPGWLWPVFFGALVGSLFVAVVRGRVIKRSAARGGR